MQSSRSDSQTKNVCVCVCVHSKKKVDDAMVVVVGIFRGTELVKKKRNAKIVNSGLLCDIFNLKRSI